MSRKTASRDIEFVRDASQGTPICNRQVTWLPFIKSARGLLAQIIFISLLMISPMTQAAAQSCKALFPAGNGQDDAAAINDCLQRKGFAKLKPGIFQLFSPIVFPRTSATAPVSGARLAGKGKEATKLVVQSQCNRLWPVGSEGQYQAAIQIVKSPQATLTGFELDLTNLREDCGAYGNYMVLVNKSPGTLVSEVRIKGSQYGVSGATYTSGGANSGGVLVVNSEDSIITDNEIKDVGFTFGIGGSSAGNGGISIASSANTQVINNRVERVAFGIVVSNGSTNQGYFGNSSQTVVTNNTVIGAANIKCPNCSAGRGIKLQACGDGSEPPLDKLTISNNEVTEFGGHNSTIGGSGIDLVCGVQNSIFENNRVIGAATAEYGLQIRGSFLSPPNPSYHNRFTNNVFASGRGQAFCGDACVDLNFRHDGPDQIGISRNGANRMGNNTVGSFFAETDRGCSEYSHPYFLFLDGREFVRHGERILLTALGARPNSQVIFKFKSAAEGSEVATFRSASVNRYCIMNQEYVAIDATRFPGGEYKIFADYKDGNSDAEIYNDEIGVIKVKPVKDN